MKTKVRPCNKILIGLGVLILGALAVSSVSCNQPARSVPPQESAVARQSATPGATTPSTPGATVIISTPTPTKEEKLLVEMQHGNIQSATSPDECAKILETQPWCNVTKSVVRIVRPEWEQLLPRTEFYLGKYDLYGGEFAQQRNVLIIEQDGQRYTAATFDRLLKVNNITTITDENREMIAKALVLMTLRDYLEEEITLSKLEKGDWPASFGFRYNYVLTAWTKIQGLQIGYFFLFDQGYLRMVKGRVNAYNTGNYINVPLAKLLPPGQDDTDYTYWGE